MNSIRTVGFAGALLALAGFAEPGLAQVEARCAQLGAECIYSEPLNFNAAPWVGKGAFDPPDSEGPGAKEADRPWEQNDEGSYASPVTGASVGLPSVGHVLQSRQPDGFGGMLHDSTEFTDGTVCFRKYMSHQPGFDRSETHYKFFEMYGGGTTSVGTPGGVIFFDEDSLKWRNADSCCTYGENGTTDAPLTAVNNYGVNPIENCTQGSDPDGGSGWCRFEMCTDHNAGRGDPPDTFRTRFRFVDIDTGEVSDYWTTNHSDNAIPRMFTGQRTWLIQTKGDASEDRFHSHGMMAIRRPADPNFWIGPAAEVGEDVGNAGGTPPPPPPPPAAPAPPLLLD